MALRNTKKIKRDQTKKEFAAGFAAGLATIGALALVLLVIFWL